MLFHVMITLEAKISCKQFELWMYMIQFFEVNPIGALGYLHNSNISAADIVWSYFLHLSHQKLQYACENL